MTEHRLKTSIAILGCGDVGSSLAYALVLQPICSEIIMVDPKTSLLEAQVRDLGDATYRGQTGSRVRVGTHKEAGQADIVVITAGAKQKPGKSHCKVNFTLAQKECSKYLLWCEEPTLMVKQVNPASRCCRGICTFFLLSSSLCRRSIRIQFCSWSQIPWTS